MSWPDGKVTPQTNQQTILVDAAPSHTKDAKNGSGSCLYATQHEVGATKHNWSLTKRFCGFDSRLVLGPVIPKTLKG